MVLRYSFEKLRLIFIAENAEFNTLSLAIQPVLLNPINQIFYLQCTVFEPKKLLKMPPIGKKIKIRFKGLPFQAFLPSLAFLPCPETVLIEIAAKNYFHFTFLSWPSVQALAMVLFISSSPSSYIFFIMSISPALGSLEASGFGSMALLLESAATCTHTTHGRENGI